MYIINGRCQFLRDKFPILKEEGERNIVESREGLFVIKFFFFRIKLNAIIRSEKLNRQCAVLGERERTVVIVVVRKIISLLDEDNGPSGETKLNKQKLNNVLIY